MKKITVQVRDDHLEFLARAKPLTALAELIWNALDAEATEVHIEFVENDLGGVDAVRVRDNGHGLHYDHALVVFKDLGGSWKRQGPRTATRKRLLHGRYGKGRFRAFALGNRVEWKPVFESDGEYYTCQIVGRAASLGEFELTDPVPSDSAGPETACPTGMIVEVTDLPARIGLRGPKAAQDMTELFALYLRQYPDVRIVYDGIPLEAATAELGSTDYDLGELVMENGKRIHAALTIVEWLIPGKRGIILCDENGFALHPVKPRILFRGFSYTAYLKSAHFAELEAGGLLQLEDMTPDLKQLLDMTRLTLRQHFALREAEQAKDTIDQWKEAGLYPYEGEPANTDEQTERLVFNIYATHLCQVPAFTNAPHPNKRLILRMLQELIRAEPTRAARILDEMLSFPQEKQDEVSNLLGS